MYRHSSRYVIVHSYKRNACDVAAGPNLTLFVKIVHLGISNSLNDDFNWALPLSRNVVFDLNYYWF